MPGRACLYQPLVLLFTVSMIICIVLEVLILLYMCIEYKLSIMQVFILLMAYDDAVVALCSLTDSRR